MLAALSPEAQINRILEQVNCAPTNFAEIADRHAISRVLQGLKGTNDFSAEDGQYYVGVAWQMKKLAEEYAEIPINWREIGRIKQILAARNQDRPVPFTVVLIGPLLFKRISSGQVETTTSYIECAAFENGIAAYDAARILSGMGQIGVRYTTITNERRAPETFVAKLADLGFESK
jgi:hypothetical protein